jgi:endoglucanase
LVHGFAGETLRGVLQPSSRPAHLLTDAERGKPVSLDDLFIDLGMSADEVRSKVELGDPITMDRTCERIGKRVISKSLDDRLLVYVMLEALRELGNHDCDIYAVATVQEEIGLRGATPAAYAINPDIAIALDITIAGDTPGGTPDAQITQLGAGTAIKIMDASLVCHPKLVRHFRDVAEQHNIKYQLEILGRGGTDAGGMQRVRGGIPAFTLSVPTRYVHTVNEMADVDDINASVQVLARWLEVCHTRSYGYGDA